MKTTASISNLFGVVLFIFFIQTSFTSYSQNIDFGKSYINITKGTTGGTVEPGDILEIRASIVVRSGTYDSCGYFDAVPAGTSFITGTIRVLTNEGKIYKQCTDGFGDDAGWITGSTIRINLGFNPANAPATPFRRGRIVNTDRPNFSSSCIMIASFQVTVNAGYGSVLNIGGGSMSYKRTFNPLTSFTYPARQVAVFSNYGICPNAVGANSIGAEFNGTFGSGKPRNRVASANVPPGYTYNIFTSNMPNDYYYGIPNNTSINTGYTTSNTWPKPDAAHRVFGVWDIIGDHTGASNPLLGNPAADTVANSNAGYMLVINAAYRIDSAFKHTISGLCPNTYYEISLWMRNICSRCGSDSAARGASTVGYIPTGPGDSSGVAPNLSFNVDGIDYYTTGNLSYTGEWVKKGFTFLTGPSQSSFTLTIFNNAPGGGGNDWALDDISVATCSPNLAFTPTNNPSVCSGNTVDIGAWIRSYFNNYVYYKWQKSVDNGLTWVNAGPVGNGSPTWNGSNWEYFTAYPTFVATTLDSGTKFRVVVASTVANIADANCSFADATSILTLNVIDCGGPLNTDIISFSGKIEAGTTKLNWTTSREEDSVQYAVEKSYDGRNFKIVATVDGYNNNADVNYYNWTEFSVNQTLYYRIRLIASGKQKFSRIIQLTPNSKAADFNVLNPFTDKLVAQINTSEAQLVHLNLIDNSGRIVRSHQFALINGTNNLQINDTDILTKGLYTLQVQFDTHTISKKVIKQ
jgi:trimeric autotransporter adhesin